MGGDFRGVDVAVLGGFFLQDFPEVAICTGDILLRILIVINSDKS